MTTQENEVILNIPEEDANAQLMYEIITKVKTSSRFMVVATNQMGKTNVILFMMRYIMNHPDNINGKWRMKFFDPAFNARFKFDKIPYIDASENATFPYFIENIRVPVPPDVQNIIVDIPYTTTSEKQRVIMNTLKTDFEYKRLLKKQYNGEVPYHDFYLVDEMQNVWGNYALRGKVGEEALTIFSESSNYNMAIIGLAQRFADVATGIVERCRYYMVGALSGANETNRLAKMVSNQKIIDKVKTLKRGEFVFIDRTNQKYFDTLVFDKFKGVGNPYQYVAPEQPKAKSNVGFKFFRTFF